MANQNPENIHSVSLQFMRLRAPDTRVVFPVNTEITDVVTTETLQDYVNHKMYHYGCGYETEFRIPNNIGELYVGEDFDSFVSLHNPMSQEVEVGIKAEIFVGTKKNLLLEKKEVLEAGGTKIYRVQQPLYDRGTHVLCCTVTYGSRPYRKVFEFDVKLPLSMNQLHVAELNGFKSGHLLVRMNLENITPKPLYIAKVMFIPHNNLFQVIDHSNHNLGSPWTHPMLPGESKKFVVELLPDKAFYFTEKITIGKFEFQWKGHYGDGGILTTSDIHFKPIVGFLPLEIFVHSVPTTIVAEEPFKIKLRIHNRTKNPMTLVASFDIKHMFPILIEGKTIQDIGVVPAGEFVVHEITLLSFQSGIHLIGRGIALRDVTKNHVYTKGGESTLFSHSIFVKGARQTHDFDQSSSIPIAREPIDAYVMEETQWDMISENGKLNQQPTDALISETVEPKSTMETVDNTDNVPTERKKIVSKQDPEIAEPQEDDNGMEGKETTEENVDDALDAEKVDDALDTEKVDGSLDTEKVDDALEKVDDALDAEKVDTEKQEDALETEANVDHELQAENEIAQNQ